MNCFLHDLIPATKRCAGCDTPFCSDCLQWDGSRWLCGACGGVVVGASPPGAGPGRGADVRLVASRVAAGLGAVAGLLSSCSGLRPLPMSVSPALMLTAAGKTALAVSLTAYVCWSLFWGVPGCYGWLWSQRRLVLPDEQAEAAKKLGWLFVFVFLLALCAFAYSVLGGGLYHYLQHRRETARPANRGSVPEIS